MVNLEDYLLLAVDYLGNKILEKSLSFSVSMFSGDSNEQATERNKRG